MPGPGRPVPTRGSAGKTVAFSGKDVREAAKLLVLILKEDPDLVEVLLTASRPTGSRAHVDRRLLLDRARRALHERRERGKHFNPSFFGEPAWDILLVLHIADLVGSRQTIGRLAAQIDAPQSTVVRWVSYLEKERLVGRESHPTDRRMVFVRLLDPGRAVLDDYFAALPE